MDSTYIRRPSFAAHRLIIGETSFSYPLLRLDTTSECWELSSFSHESEAVVFLSGSLLLCPADLSPHLPADTQSVTLSEMQSRLHSLQTVPVHLYHFPTVSSLAHLLR
ncbi:MAG: hypothetical protein ACTTH9_04325 [Porphyromonas gingivalis]|uniref:hypothetical protein n=1 Tax=Porphyromonas gingivalis TaxID=837 RepID=UPI0003ACE77A|nr:hypothetical protein [Porphyromonas gingivalis]ERJ81493.1 hypothetical protein HMPREF1988_01989 [Porphyromonas gingivalis F0185]